MSRILQRPVLEILAIAYVVLFGLSYLADPLALAPQLDGRENLQLASQISSGTLAAEPFYRAMFYPWLLSLVPTESLRPIVAGLFGLMLHIAAALLVRSLAQQVWQRTSAAKLGFFVYLLNPVSLFFALQVMDMTLAIVLFLGALRLLVAPSSPSARRLLAGGLLLGLACATRPHFLPVALITPMLLVLRRRTMREPVLAYAGLGILLLLNGSVNHLHSGEFRILPWQGSYNLYAANRPGANGLYYKQEIDVSGNSYMNPARAESEILYQRATQPGTPLSIEGMSRHWRNRAIQSFTEDPVRMVKLWAYKAYAVFNSYEQYNNLTYGYHKSRLTFLRFNPLNWGILLLLGSTGAFVLYRRDKQAAIASIALLAGYAVSLVIYYASARFRLPMVPLLAVLSGGVVVYWKDLPKPPREWLPLAAILAAMSVLTFSSFGGIRNRDTYIQDRLLLANANADLGRDAAAARLARVVLSNHPDRREAQRIYTISYFNMRLIQSGSASEFGTWGDQQALVTQSPPTDPVQDVILGVYFWQWGKSRQALDLWNFAVTRADEGAALAQACQIAAGMPGIENYPNKQLVGALEQLFAEKE